jgi:anti-sigma factor RsiW
MERSPCNDIRKQLDDYLDQEATPHEARQVREHLDSCICCATVCHCAYRELAAIRARIQKVAVPGDLMRRITRRLASHSGSDCGLTMRRSHAGE